MEMDKRALFLATIGNKYLPAEKLSALSQALENISNEKLNELYCLDYKNPSDMFVVSLLAGTFGIDRFMVGETGLGILKLITCGGFGIWAIVDWFYIREIAKEKNFEKVLSVISMMYSNEKTEI